MENKMQVLYLLTVLFLSFSCDNEPYEGEFLIEGNSSCDLAMESTSIALENFNSAIEDNFNLLCQIYKDALENQFEICGDADGALQVIIDDLGNCIADNLCEEAIAASEIARIIFESAADETIDDLCNAYKDALEYQIEVCDDDDDALQNLIDDLDNCETEEVDIAGNWKLVAWNTDQLRDIDNDGFVTNNYLDDIDCYNNETILFNSNGTGIMFLRSSAEFTYTPTVDGEDFFVVCTDIDIDRSFNWTETINSVTLLFADGSSMSLFKNGGLYIAIDDAFYATSTVDSSVITERITFIYIKL
tara:strand:+ start:211 stop:1119 length:909 start_codon:yes stop_codon:yes gene_type:complete